jgi:signal transduction histidine kinase
MMLLDPEVPSLADELSEAGRNRLRARAREELLRRTFTGTFVYPIGLLVVAWSIGLLAEYPRPVFSIAALLGAIVALRVVLYRRALETVGRVTLAARAHILLGVVSAAIFSSAVGAAYLLRGGDAGTTAGYVAMAAIAGGVAMIASTHRRLAMVWVLATVIPGLVVFAIRGDDTSLTLIVMYALYLPVLRRMIVRNHESWWEAQIAAVRLDEKSREVARLSRRAGMAENAANVLHDVGNALNAVKTSADLLAKSRERHPTSDLDRLAELVERHRDDLPAFVAAEGPKIVRFLDALASDAREHAAKTNAEATRLQSNVRHIETIVRRQRAVARETGGFHAHPVAELVDSALGLSRAAHLEVDVELDEHVRRGVAVAADRDRVLQILVNLLENACDATTGGGKITVRASAEDRSVLICVADDGQGIPPEIAHRIFSRGFTTKPHGHGFGLHGSFALAQAMGGALSFESAGLGRGAVFRVRLPLAGALAA